MEIFKILVPLIIYSDLIQASTVIDYHFSKNFGKVFNDYSGNSNKAVNGESLTTGSRTVISTDRGAYFPSSSSTIKIPSNELVPLFSFPSYFSLSMWLQIEDYTFYCFYCSSQSSLFYIIRYLASSSLGVYLSDPKNPGSELHTSTNTMQNTQWKLILIKVDTSVTLTINSILQLTYTLNLPFTLNLVNKCLIGESYAGSSLIGFVWSFSLFNSSESLSSFISGASSNCILSGCSPCSYSIIINSTSWCLPDVDSQLTQSVTTTCKGCFGCYSAQCLNCSLCSMHSCEYTAIAPNELCICPSGSASKFLFCNCDPGSFLSGGTCLSCIKDCATCSNSVTCDTCVALNAVPVNGGCVCKDGYYNISALVNSNSCISCGDKCKICDQNGGCLECKVVGALGSMSCQCPDGYFDNIINCKACHIECSKCVSFGPCISCISMHASPSKEGCECLPYHGGTKPLSSLNSCTECHPSCQDCKSKDKCLTCKDPNSEPAEIGCKCKDGYYLDDQCQPCFADCISCNKTNCLKCWDALAQVNEISCVCPVGTYLVSTSPTKCASCRGDCKTCSDGLTCDECLIAGAVKQTVGCACQSGYISDSIDCVKCASWDESSKHCIFCNHQEYFDGSACVSCPKLCTHCDTSGCSECVENAEIVEKECLCLSQYQGTTECVLKEFSLKVTPDKENNLALEFSLNLYQKLTENMIKITIDEVSFTYSVVSYNQRFYYVQIDYFTSFNRTLQGTLDINIDVFSEFNTSLSISKYSFAITPKNSSNNQASTNSTYKALGSSSVYVAFSITMFLSIFNLSFISFWNFLNVMQVLIYIRLLNLNLPNKFDLILQSLKDTTNAFDIFKYLIKNNHFPELKGRYFTFGFKVSLFFSNCGNWISVLISVVINDIILLLIYISIEKLKFFSSSFLKTFLTKLRQNFRYNAYIRYWIQSYLDIGVSAVVNIMFFEIKSVAEMFGIIFSLVFLGIVAVIPIVSVIFMKKHREDIERNNDELLNKYGSLFYEVSNDRGLLVSYFYSIFFMKRFLYIVIIFSLQSYPLLQLLLSMILNISFVLYLYYVKPYSEKLISYSNIFSESATSSIYFLLTVNLILNQYVDTDLIDHILVALIYSIFIFQSTPPFIIFFNKIRLKIKQFYSRAKVVPEVPLTAMTDIVHHIQSNIKTGSSKMIEVSNNL